MTTIERAYVAGIVDGEGAVLLSRRRDRTMRDGLCYRPYVCVSNTARSLPYLLKAVTGQGHVRRNAVPRNPNAKPSWRWEVWSQRAGEVLRSIEPYLTVKHRQARLVILFCQRATRRPGRDGLTTAERQFQIKTYRQLKVLNRRGVR